MRRGTRVGQAYIAITADGSSINEDIVDGFEDVDYDKIGKKGGAKVGRAFEKSMSDTLRRSLKNVDKAVESDLNLSRMIDKMISKSDTKGRLDSLYNEVARRAGVNFSGEFGKAVRASVHRDLKAALRSAAEDTGRDKQFMKSLIKSIGIGDGDYSMLLPGKMLEDSAKRVRAVADRVRDEEKKAEIAYTRFLETQGRERAANYRAALESQGRHERWLMGERKRIAAETEKMWESLLARRDDDDRFLRFAKQASEMVSNIKLDPRIDAASIRRFERRLQAQLERRDALTLELEADLPLRERERIKAEIESIDATIQVDLDRKRLNEELLRATQGSRRDTRNAGIGGFVGAMFGAGSRNNFLNLLGRTMGGIAKLTERSFMFATGFAEGIGKAAQNAGLLQRLMAGLRAGSKASGLAGVLSRIAAAGPAAAAALVVVVTAVVALSSAAMALVGALTAMVSTIAAGLVGALSVASGAILATAAAAGLLTVAFTSMTDAQRELVGEAFKPLKEGLTGLGQIMLQPMFAGSPSPIEQWAINLRGAITQLIPVARAMGPAFAEAGNIITRSLSGGGFQKFADSLATYLPSITTRMSQAFANFGNGLMAVFAAVMPMVNRFAGYLERLTARFDNWANSAKGQNAITDFVNRATDSLKSLWGFVREFAGFIFDVLFSPQAMQAGNTIFDGMRDTFIRFRDAVAKAQASGDLQKWFDDAIYFGSRLWDVLEGIGKMFMSLYNSYVLRKFADILGDIARGMDKVADAVDWAMDKVGSIPGFVTPAISVLGKLDDALSAINGGGSPSFSASGSGGGGGGGSWGSDLPSRTDSGSPGGRNLFSVLADRARSVLEGASRNVSRSTLQWDWLRGSGRDALNVTSEKYGGYLPDPSGSSTPATYVNPFTAWAKSLIDNGPTIAQQIRDALNKSGRDVVKAFRTTNRNLTRTLIDENKIAAAAIRASSKAEDRGSVVSALRGAIQNMRSTMQSDAKSLVSEARSTAQSMRSSAESLVSSARSALNSAAQSLASASTPESANAALAEVNRARADLANALSAQKQINARANQIVNNAVTNANRLRARVRAANKIIKKQEVLSSENVRALMAGAKVTNATLADYARARERVSRQLERANQKLTEAISLRDDYRRSVTDSVRSFGSLLTAEAKVIDGVQQSLTHEDITGNLQSRLEKIRNFQDNLRVLLAHGLSNDAYKQILAGGVEQGSAYVDALVEGGVGAVDQVNSLVDGINKVADELGLESSNRLYQAGVDAAQGLVDGLESLSGKLDSAAARLGETIARAVKRALGIKSPSTVMIGLMDDVGDGSVIGLDRQHGKLAAASERFANAIAVSPRAAALDAQMRAAQMPVSGNAPLVGEVNIHTPTKDPHAVAVEAVNEIVGRL